MNVNVEIEISEPKATVWRAITDFDHWSTMISGIKDIDIVNLPEEGIVGLKWKETRLMFGKEAVETMWITEAIANHHYCTRAESHGSVYITRLSVSDLGQHTLLSMSFTSKAQSLLVEILSACMGPFIKSSMKKFLLKDLVDIKNFVENSG